MGSKIQFIIMGGSPEAQEHIKKLQEVLERCGDEQMYKDIFELKDTARIYNYSEEEIKESIKRIVKKTIERMKQREGLNGD